MLLLCSILGLVIYFLANRAGLDLVVLLVGSVALAGCLLYLSAVRFGARTPRFTAAALTASVLCPIGLGSAGAAALIWLTGWIVWLRRGEPAPAFEAYATAVLAVLGMVAERSLEMKRFLPGQVARAVIERRYRTVFPKLRGEDTAAYRNAYYAVFGEQLSDDDGAIHGWGFSAMVRRLRLIRKALPVDPQGSGGAV